MAREFPVLASSSPLFLLLLLLIFLFPEPSLVANNLVDAIPPQDKMKNFTKLYISPFFTDDQLFNMSKTIAAGCYQELAKDAIYHNVFNNVMVSLTANQVGQGVQFAFCFLLNGLGSTTLVFNAVDVAATAIGNRLKAVYNQTLTKVRSMKAVPRGVNAVYQQVYRIGAQFESQSNICILMTSAKNAMSVTNWATFRKCLGSVIRYTNCGY